MLRWVADKIAGELSGHRAKNHVVEIYGTEGDGLRLRNAPGLSATIHVLALENEVYEVRGGPENMDGYVWWFLINPYDNEIQGWSVGTFLRAINQ